MHWILFIIFYYNCESYHGVLGLDPCYGDERSLCQVTMTKCSNTHVFPFNKKLTAVPNNLPSHCRELNLYSHNFESITHSELNHLKYLTQLSLASNKIKDIHVHALRGMKNLTKLNLSSNKLHELKGNSRMCILSLINPKNSLNMQLNYGPVS